MNTENAIKNSNDVYFDIWAMKWLEIYKKGMVKDNSYWGTYFNPVVKHLIPYFGHATLREIKPMDVQLFFKIQGKGYSLESLRKMRAALKAVFDTAIENDLCQKNPVTKSIRLKSNIDSTEKQAYSQEQYDTVMNFAKRYPLVDIMVLLETGISRSELLGLRWTDIDFENNVISINQGTVSFRSTDTGEWLIKSDGLKNEYRQRKIPISDELANLLKSKPQTICVGGNHKKHIPPKKVETEYVFHSPTGKVFAPDNWYNRVYKPFIQAMHKENPDIPPLHVHELRHTRATLWYEDNVNLLTIAYLGGWTDLKMLRKRYAHINIQKVKQELQKCRLAE